MPPFAFSALMNDEAPARYGIAALQARPAGTFPETAQADRAQDIGNRRPAACAAERQEPPTDWKIGCALSCPFSHGRVILWPFINHHFDE